MSIPTPVLIKNQTPKQLAELAPWCVIASTTDLESFGQPFHLFHVCESIHALRELKAKHRPGNRYNERIYPCADAQIATEVRQQLLALAATAYTLEAREV